MNEAQLQAAKEGMISWLAHPSELGKPPAKIEFVGEFDLHELHYYIFKFKKSIIGKWFVGVCGGYEDGGLQHCGHVFSDFKEYNAATAEKTCIQMVERIREYWINEAEKIRRYEEEPIDWSKQYEVVEQLGIRDYIMQYAEVCKTIWQTFVPESGSSGCVQGELLRQMEKLRNEACDNGNINWDDDFVYFCDFIEDTLIKSNLFDTIRCEKISKCLSYIKENGEYARSLTNGDIPEYEVDVVKLAYTHDDLYDYVEDAIGEFYLANTEPIEYVHPDGVRR